MIGMRSSTSPEIMNVEPDDGRDDVICSPNLNCLSFDLS